MSIWNFNDWLEMAEAVEALVPPDPLWASEDESRLHRDSELDQQWEEWWQNSDLEEK